MRPILAALVAVAASALLLSPAAVAADATAPVGKAKGSKAPATSASNAKGAKAPPAAPPPKLPKLSAAEILKRHVAARGGAQAWKSVQTLQLKGKLEAGRGDNIARALKLGKKGGRKGTNAEVAAAAVDPKADKQILLPFTLDLKRPNRMRLEIEFDGKTAVQVFDGKQGWKYRPFLNRKDAEPFTAEEAQTEASRGDLDGPLVDSAAKGTKVEVEGTDLVDAKPAYRLKVTPKSGPAKHVWIDAKSFLDVKVEGAPRRVDGKVHPVYVYQRDFRSVQGVLIPFVQETAVDGSPDTHKLLVEKASINPTFADAVFSKPRA
jgi:hypothetical protein